MNKIDTQKIGMWSNELIAYKIMERRENMKRMKTKKVVVTLGIFALLITGTCSVDAMTGNAISNTAKEIIADTLKIKVNDKDYNAQCEKREDGILSCKVDKSVLGDGEIDVEASQDILDNTKIEYKDNELEIDIK